MNIDDMTYEELIDLNRCIVERLKLLDHIRTHTEMMQFKVGERVCFQPTGREQLVGTLVKYNKKTVTVITDSGEHWNVAPRLLSKDAEQSPRLIDQGKVIDIDEGMTA